MCGAGAMFGAQVAMQLGGALMKSNAETDDYWRKIAAARMKADAIRKSTVFQYAQDGLQEQQAQNQEAVQEGQARLKLSGAEGQAVAAATSGGVTGNSVAALMRTYEVATGTDISNLRAQRDDIIGQGEAQKKGQSMSAENQMTALKANLPKDPATSIMGHFLNAALGIGNSFMSNTTKVDASAASGGLFGGGGFLGTGRNFG